MASINSLTPQTFRSLSKPIKDPNSNPKPTLKSFTPISHNPSILFKTKHKDSLTVVRSVSPKELAVIPVQSSDFTDHEDGLVSGIEREIEPREEIVNQLVGGFGNDQMVGGLSFEGAAGGFSPSPASSSGSGDENLEESKLIDRAINASIVFAASAFAITKLLTIDHDYWHGWTLFEIVRYAPQHNWSAYEEALRQNPVLAKMVISGVVYSLGDWIAQCVEGKPLFEFDRTRMLRSGLVGFTLHGSLSHYYYYFCEALFPFQGWWVVPVKVAFDQTIWAGIWNSIYYVVLGFLRFESPVSIFTELKTTFWPMLTAGWKLWPFAHVITYGVIPVEQRLLWVDCVELIWVTILSTLSNEKSEARILEEPVEADSSSLSLGSSEE